MARIHEIATARPEVTAGDLHGIVSLFALLREDGDAFERDAQRVLSATYPSEALRAMLHRLSMALSKEDADRRGNFIVSGGYGSGKSHLLLVLYHLLNSPDIASEWLNAHGIDFRPPSDGQAILLPMQQYNMPGKHGVDYLWEPIFHQLGYQGFVHTGNNFPTAKHLTEAIGDRRVFLIIDEMERWYGPIRDLHQAHANETFLQNLTEFSEDPAHGLITFITLLRLSSKITDIIDRVEGFREDMTQAPDRRQIVLHRLVEHVDQDAATTVVDAYLAQYQQLETHIPISDPAHFRDEMLTCYPFHPAAVQTVFDQYSSVARQEESSYQNSRGALYLLSHVLRQALPTAPGGGSLSNTDLILAGDISLANDQVCDDLQALNPRLVDIAQTNVRSSADVECATSVLSTVLLNSLSQAAEERTPGAEFGEILMGTVRPAMSTAGAVSPNQVQACLVKLEDTALNLHRVENPPRWILKAEVNILGKINSRARRPATVERAAEEIVRTLRELLGGSVAVYPHDDVPDARDITLVVCLANVENDEVLRTIYHGKQYPNGLVVVAPRSPGSILEDRDLLWQAQRKIAATEIRDELRAAGQEVPSLLSSTAAGTDLPRSLEQRYGKWLAPIYDPTTNEVSFRRYDVALDTGSILSTVEKRYDENRFQRDVMQTVRQRGGSPPTVAEVRADFYRQKSYAKPICGARHSEAYIDNAIRDLVRTAELEVIVGGDAHYICGKDPNTLDKDWVVAIPPEEHKPSFDLTQTILGFLKVKGQAGASVDDVRGYCGRMAAQVPGTELDSGAVDARLVELLGQQRIETPSSSPTLAQPLSGTMRVHVPAAGPIDHKVQLQIPPESLVGVPVQQARTLIIQAVLKTDKLSDVRLDVTQHLAGPILQGTLGQLLGVQGITTQTTKLEASYHLSGLPVGSRDELVALLDRLPTEGDVEVVVRFLKEATPEGGVGAAAPQGTTGDDH